MNFSNHKQYVVSCLIITLSILPLGNAAAFVTIKHSSPLPKTGYTHSPLLKNGRDFTHNPLPDFTFSSNIEVFRLKTDPTPSGISNNDDDQFNLISQLAPTFNPNRIEQAMMAGTFLAGLGLVTTGRAGQASLLLAAPFAVQQVLLPSLPMGDVLGY